jgi:hypothetical protein
MHRVQRGAAEEAGVEIALACADVHVEVGHAPKRRVERGHVALVQVAVEDDCGVRPALVGCDPFDDGLTADLLLGVEREPEVDRKLARLGELARRLDEHEEMRLVVGDAAGVEPPVALGQLERRRLPEVERVGRLHVEVRVAEDRRRGIRALGGGQLADDERAPAVPGDDVGRAAGAADALRDPVRGGLDVLRVVRVRADRGNGDQLGELRAQLLVRRRHGGIVGARLASP